jgi:MFS family permease
MVESATQPSALGLTISRTFLALGHPGFRRYYIGQGISLVGTWLQAAAVRWIVYERTNSEFMLGVVEVTSLLPGIMVGLYAGALADRIAPLRMIVLMECGQMALAFLLSFLLWLQIVQIWQMALILALARICVTFELPSRQVFFYELVGPEILSNAIALNSGLFNATRVLGPALAGLGLSLFGAAGCFAANAVSYLAAIAALLSIRLAPRSSHREAMTFRSAFGGLGYLRSDRRIFAQFVLVALFGLVAMGYEAMVPAYARRVVQTGVQGYSALLACGGIGATVGAFVAASLASMRHKERLTILGMVCFGIALACAATLRAWLPPAAPAWARVSAGAACLLAAGVGAVFVYSSSMMLIQLAVPDHLRGRIMGIWMIVYSGSVPLGALWTGRVAQSWGVGFVMGLSAALCVLMAMIVMGSGVLASPAGAAGDATYEPAAADGQ